jgi:hypothetical protein
MVIRQGTYTDHRNMVEYLVSGPLVMVRMRNRDGSWTNYEEALHGVAQLIEHIESGHLTFKQ